MLIGNSNQISLSMLSPANTLASLLASNFPEAGEIERQALMFAALVLLAITLVVYVMCTFLLALTTRRISGKQ
jgi:phosphate transport system permease protein